MAAVHLHLLLIFLFTSASEIPQETLDGGKERLTGGKVKDGGNMEGGNDGGGGGGGKTPDLVTEVSPPPSYHAQNISFPPIFPPVSVRDGGKEEREEKEEGKFTNHTNEEEEGEKNDKTNENMKSKATETPYCFAQNTSLPPTFPPALGRDGGEEEEEERRCTNHTKEEEEEEEDEEGENEHDKILNTTEAPKSPYWTPSTNGSKIYFCGTPDINEAMKGDQNNSNNHTRPRRYVLQGKKWDKTELSWTLRRPSRHTSRLSEGTIRAQLHTAFQVWEKASALKFTEVHKTSKNIDIYVDFEERNHGDGYNFDGRGRVLAHAFYPGGGIGGDMHFDDEDNFVHHSKREPGKSSLLITAAHELGHSLGLSHSDVDRALMAPIYQDFGDDFDLPLDDKYAIQALYGAPEDDRKDLIPTQPPRTTPGTTTTTRRPLRPTRQPRPTYRPPTSRPRPPTSRPRPPTSRPRPTTTPRPPRPRPTTSTTTLRPPIEEICHPSKPKDPSEPDICFTDIDAVTKFRGELFFFKGEYYWRLNRKGRPYWREYPWKISSRFQPVRTVDAAYETKKGDLIFFEGHRFFQFRLSNYGLQVVQQGYLSHLNINTTHLNAAMLWGHNGRAYAFSNDKYWRLNQDGVADLDYPRDIAVWRGIPQNISAAFTIGYKTFFLSGPVYWVFDNAAMRAKETPLLTSVHWLSCPQYGDLAPVKCFSGLDKLQGSDLLLIFCFLVLNVK